MGSSIMTSIQTIPFTSMGHGGIVDIFPDGLIFVHWRGCGSDINSIKKDSIVRLAAEAAMQKESSK